MRTPSIFHPTPYLEINAVLNELLNGAQSVLGERFVGLYLYGSLASGDFNLRRSDIDFVVVTAMELAAQQVAGLEAMHRQLWAGGGKWAAKLEGSYVPRALLRRPDPAGPQCPTVNEGQFYLSALGADWIFQRYILRENGVIAAGPALQHLIDPVNPEDLRQAVRGFFREWWQPMLAEPARLRSREYQAYAVLTMCRALYTLRTGDIASKPASAGWAQAALGEPWSALIEQALAWPDGPQPDRLTETVEFIRAVLKKASI